MSNLGSVEDFESEAEACCEAEGTARECLINHIDELTRTGQFAPSRDRPTPPVDRLTQKRHKELLTGINLHASTISYAVRDYVRLYNSRGTDEERRILDGARTGHFLPTLGENVPSTATIEARKARLAELAAFEPLKALMEKDAEAWKAYADNQGIINETTAKKDELRKKILALFHMLNGA